MDFPSKSVVDAIGELQPGIVVCRYDTASIGLLQSLHGMDEPPMVVLLHESRAARDEVSQMDGLIVAVVRAPVPMVSLCAFVRTALATTANAGRQSTRLSARIRNEHPVPLSCSELPPLVGALIPDDARIA
jgi:hypothetical protein